MARRQDVYAQAGGGWYGSGGGTVRAGLVANLDVSAAFQLNLRAGVARSEELEMARGLPFYALLGGAARF